METELPEVLATLVLGPTDRLVVVLPARTSPEEFAAFQQVLAERDWGTQVMVLANIEQLAVLRGETTG